MGNVPAFDAGAQILAELRNIVQRLDALERGVAGISTRLSSADYNYNAIARLTNSSLATTADSRLSPLRTPDNQEVPDFPLTPGDIDRLNSADLNAILNSYGLPTVGVVAVRRRQLKKYLGITMAGI